MYSPAAGNLQVTPMQQTCILLAWAALWLPSAHAQAQLKRGDTVFYATPGRSVKDQDFSCGLVNNAGKVEQFCRECPGGVAAMATKCSMIPKCRGFEMEDWSCGILKEWADSRVLQDKPASVTYCKATWGPATTDCPGTYRVLPHMELVGGDFDCNWTEEGVRKTYCLYKGNHLANMQACSSNHKCKAFTLNELGNIATWANFPTSTAVKFRPAEGKTVFIRLP